MFSLPIYNSHTCLKLAWWQRICSLNNKHCMKKTRNIHPKQNTDQIPVDPPPRNQLLDEQAEEYLREGGNIEDLPTPEQEEQIDKLTNDKKRKH